MATVKIDKRVLRVYHELEAIRLGYYSIEHAALLRITSIGREIRIFWLKKRPVEEPKTLWGRFMASLLRREEYDGPDKKVDVGLFDLGTNDRIFTELLSNDSVQVIIEPYYNIGNLQESKQSAGFSVIKEAQKALRKQGKQLTDPFYIEIEGWPGELPKLIGES